MPATIITTDDLREFRIQLLADISKLLKSTSSAESKKYLKTNEMLKLLKVSYGTLQTFRINGTIPYIKTGGIYFYDADEIYKLMKENRFHHTN